MGREADAEPEATADAEPGYLRSYGYGSYGRSYGGYGGYGYGRVYGGYGGYSRGYYGKREADAEPEATADAEPGYLRSYGYGGYGRTYGGYGGYGYGHSYGG